MEPIQLIDYPDFGHPVATDVAEGKVNFGIIIAEAVTENDCKQTSESTRRFCWMKEIAPRQHNDANIISIPARYTSFHRR
jgi:ribose 5-phosphate isomerase B